MCHCPYGINEIEGVPLAKARLAILIRKVPFHFLFLFSLFADVILHQYQTTLHHQGPARDAQSHGSFTRFPGEVLLLLRCGGRGL